MHEIFISRIFYLIIVGYDWLLFIKICKSETVSVFLSLHFCV